MSSLAELVDRELNDEELDKVSGKEDIRRKLALLLKAATAEDEEDMKRTSSTAASAQETTRTKVGGHLAGFFLDSSKPGTDTQLSVSLPD